MLTIDNKYFIAEGSPGNKSEQSDMYYEASWTIWSGDGWEENDAPVKHEEFAHGHVKWDGCSNWSFANGSYMFHSCDRERLAAIGDILAMCFDRSKELIPETWCE